MVRSMPARRNGASPRESRIHIIDAVKTPLAFFVLVVLIVEGLMLYELRGSQGADADRLTWAMLGLLVFMVLIVASIAIFRPEALGGTRPSIKSKSSLLITGPESLPTLDITNIEWDDDQCFLVANKLRAGITVVPARVGPAFRVEIPSDILGRLSLEFPVSLDLRDRKGNRWKVRPFFLSENWLRLTVVENIAKIVEDYSEEQS